MANLEAALSDSSFAAFVVRRDASARLIFRHPGRGAVNSELLKACAWLTPASSRAGGLGETRQLKAERYGGRGIGHNGGGARCGLSGSLQIKGTGCNSLRGRDVPADYAHGGMSLFECIQESLWSEVFSHALPFGAVRTLGVLGSDEQCWWVTERWGAEALAGRYGSPPNLPRGLLVRPAALRPAHFERAALYRPVGNAREELQRDLERTRCCLMLLPQLLPAPAGGMPKGASLEEVLEAGLVEMATRYAMQSAAAMAKRLVHGNITSSNICLDGRWIDFGSATAIPQWGSACGYGPFWADQGIYSDIFSELLLHCRRFLGIDRVAAERILCACVGAYGRTHDEWLTKRFAATTGVPWILFDDAEGTRRAAVLARTLIRLARIGGEGYLSPHPDHHATFGRFRMYELMHALAHCDSDAQRWSVALQELGDVALASQLSDAYASFLLACEEMRATRDCLPVR